MAVDSTAAPVSAVLDALSAAGLRPESSPRRLAEYSFDASNYRVVPQAVVFPRSAAEIAAAARICHAHGVALTARGGGTSMAGNSIGAGVILDLSRHMNQVLDVDEEAGTVHAQGGAVLTEIRAAVHAATGQRRTFAPDPSSQARACLGGTLGNDACGNHSVKHGRTSDHVVELNVITADGVQLTATETGIRATNSGDTAAALRAEELESQLQELVAANLAVIRTELSRIPRQVSGYHLSPLLPERGFNVARALVGSEGSCAIISSAVMRTVPRPADTVLVVAGYADVVEAARDVELLRSHCPAAIEGVDDVIVNTMRVRRGADAVAELPQGQAWLFIELEDGDAPGSLADRAAALASDLRAHGHALDTRTVLDAGERADLWRVREDGAGLSSRLSDPATGELIESWPGWEDAAVPPENLADYLAEFRELLSAHGLTGVMYGHFGAGCMHIRISFDLRSAEGRAVMRAFCTDAARLAVRYGGSLSGEHGDGRARSELLPLMYSETMLAAFEQFGRIWDPAGILAPGGLRATEPIDANLALAGVPRRDLGLLTSGDGKHPVQACIGVGRCRTHSGGVMCPSYRATGDEKDSTRGRARVLQELIRGERLVDAWASTEVAESLELCLACKACSSDCPTGVDMATFKSEFLDRHWAGRLRPVTHYTLGMLPTWLRVTPWIAPVLNRLAGVDLLRRFGARIAGVSTTRAVPRFASRGELAAPLRSAPESVRFLGAAARLVGQGGRRGRGGGSGAVRAPGAVSAPEVVLFLDSFTRGIRANVAGAAVRAVGAAHGEVACTAEHCCGLTDITTGRRDKARAKLAATADYLDAIRGEGGAEVPIVVVEPSCAATLHRELPLLVDSDQARRVAARVKSAASYVAWRLEAADGRSPWEVAEETSTIIVQTHCHEYAGFGNRIQRRALAALGVSTLVEATGCCGVAGDFGFTAGHEDVANAVAEHALAPAMREHVDATVLTDGFSCSTQVEHIAAGRTGAAAGPPERRGVHLFELIDPGRGKAGAPGRGKAGDRGS